MCFDENWKQIYLHYKLVARSAIIVIFDGGNRIEKKITIYVNLEVPGLRMLSIFFQFGNINST